MINSWKWKKSKWIYKRYKFLKSSQNERVGAARLELMETLTLIIKNDKLRDYKII
jgi:hypothetical protein